MRHIAHAAGELASLYPCTSHENDGGLVWATDNRFPWLDELTVMMKVCSFSN